MADDDLRSYWADVVPDHPVPHAGEKCCNLCGVTESKYAKVRAEHQSFPENGFIEAKNSYTSRVFTICIWCNMHLLEHYEAALEPRFRKRYEIRLKELLEKLRAGATDLASLLGELESE